MDDDVVEKAKAKGVSIIISPYDSSTTAWVVRTASSIERVVDRNFGSVGKDARISEIRRKISTLAAPAFMVLEEDGTLAGILSKSDILKPIQTKLILVDHNEISQAVNGADEVVITEIIDHHRLGAMNTQTPILFINEPVGSTCTIVGDMFRRAGLVPLPETAGIMMSGLISDTLLLNSPTTPPKDAEVLSWLSSVAGEEPRVLAEAIFSSGSVIQASTPEAIVEADHKVYEEEGVRFAVSQVEELGFGSFWSRAKSIASALEALRTRDGREHAELAPPGEGRPRADRADHLLAHREGRDLRPARDREPQEAADPVPHEPSAGDPDRLRRGRRLEFEEPWPDDVPQVEAGGIKHPDKARERQGRDEKTHRPAMRAVAPAEARIREPDRGPAFPDPERHRHPVVARHQIRDDREARADHVGEEQALVFAGLRELRRIGRDAEAAIDRMNGLRTAGARVAAQ